MPHLHFGSGARAGGVFVAALAIKTPQRVYWGTQQIRRPPMPVLNLPEKIGYNRDKAAASNAGAHIRHVKHACRTRDCN